jgi:hypothetical protein
MEHRDRAVELRPDRCVAGNRKIHFAKFAYVTRRMFMFMLSNDWPNKERAA